MGSRGPAPTPTKILQARGSWLADTIVDEPKAPPGKPTKPSWVTGEAATVWARLWKGLEQTGLAATTDWGSAGRYAVTLARWIETESRIGMTDDTSELYKLNQISESLDIRLAKFERSFGLTPSARRELGQKRENPDENRGRRRTGDNDSVRAKLFA